MDTKKVGVLLRAIELGSLSKAAEEYCYTPSAVLHIANALEDELGISLLKRTHSGITAHDDATEVIEKLREFYELGESIIRTAKKQNLKKTVTIATYASLMKNVLPGIIKNFKKRFPDIDINLLVDDNMQTVYEDKRADILFGEQLDIPDIMWEEFLTENYVAVFSDSIKNPQPIIPQNKLLKEHFILPEDSKTIRYVSEMPENQIIRINSSDDSSVIQMVREGVGVSVLPRLSVSGSRGVYCAELDPPLTRTLGFMCRKKDFSKNTVLKKFVQFSKDYINKKEI